MSSAMIGLDHWVANGCPHSITAPPGEAALAFDALRVDDRQSLAQATQGLGLQLKGAIACDLVSINVGLAVVLCWDVTTCPLGLQSRGTLAGGDERRGRHRAVGHPGKMFGNRRFLIGSWDGPFGSSRER